MMKHTLRKFFSHLEYRLSTQIEHAKPYAIIVGWFGVVAHPAWYIYWVYFSGVGDIVYENLLIRVIGFFSVLTLAFINRLPRLLQPYSALLYVMIITYNFPFFEMLYVLQNGHGTPSLLSYEMTMIATIVILALLTNLLLFILSLTVGISTAIIVYITTAAHPVYPEYFFDLVNVGIYAIVFGGIFTYNNTLYHRRKIQAMHTTCTRIFHEIKTPLLSIILTEKSIDKKLKLWQESNDTNEIAQKISTDLTLINKSSLAIKHTIELLSANIQRQKKIYAAENNHPISVLETITASIQNYPFSAKKDYQLIHIKSEDDFKSFIAPQLLQNIIFNLLNNALREIHKKNQGEIYITLETGKNYNYLYFQDTAGQINTHDLDLIFMSGFSRYPEGLGLGLAFCREVMRSIGGDIVCSNKAGHTTFELFFPYNNKNNNP